MSRRCSAACGAPAATNCPGGPPSAASCREPSMPSDLATLIAHDHQVITKLLDALGDTTRADRFPLAHRVIDEIAAHTAAELQILYPALRDIVPGGVALANRGPTDHDT